MIPLLIGIPAVLAVLFQFVRNEKAQGVTSSMQVPALLCSLQWCLSFRWVTAGAQKRGRFTRRQS